MWSNTDFKGIHRIDSGLRALAEYQFDRSTVYIREWMMDLRSL
jgi:hypothetical protein